MSISQSVQVIHINDTFCTFGSLVMILNGYSWPIIDWSHCHYYS